MDFSLQPVPTHITSTDTPISRSYSCLTGTSIIHDTPKLLIPPLAFGNTGIGTLVSLWQRAHFDIRKSLILVHRDDGLWHELRLDETYNGKS
jgi:hypothetical protein